MYNRWLCHYGVKGMKWGVRKRRDVQADEYYVLSTLTQKERDQYNGWSMNDSQYQGRKARKRERSRSKYYKELAKEAYEQKVKPDEEDPLFLSLVDKQGDPMGVVIGQRRRDWETKEHYMNLAIAVTKKYQGKQVSERLVNEGKKWFDEHPEYSEIRWYAVDTNIRSQKLAEKSGFKRINKDKYGDPLVSEVAYSYKRKR